MESPLDKIRVVYDAEDHSCATFKITDESHTIGNALRNVVSRRPDVDFCAYSIPHPIEPVLNFRIQTRNNVPPLEVMQGGLSTLKDMTTVVLDRFSQALESTPMEC
ncbi:hypothetical protein GEMRC1_007751 [Eukaryota sp. GEM-RC1]